MPASLWPVQPFMPPSDPLQPPVWPSSSAAGWSMPRPAPPPGWAPAPADTDADTSVSAWDRAMRQALAANGSAASPSDAVSAWSDQMLADAKRAHDFVMWAFGPPSAAPTASTGTVMAPGAPQYAGDAPSKVVAAPVDTVPQSIRSPEAEDANAPTQAPAGADEQPDLSAAYGNSNIARQGERARAVVAMRRPSGAGVRARMEDVPGSDSSQSQVGPTMSTAGQESLPSPFPPNVGFKPNRDLSPWSEFDNQIDRITKVGKILGIVGGWEPLPDPASVTLSTSPYGVVAKKPLPPEFALPPPPPSAWQLPEPGWFWGTPAENERVKRQVAAGIPLDKIFAPGRVRRDLARLSDFLFHGSGNFVSGDPVTLRDDENLGLSLFRTFALGLLGPEGAGARAAAEILEAPEAVGAAQAAHAAAMRGASARTTGPFIDTLDALPGPRLLPAEPFPARPARPVQPASPVEPGDVGGAGLQHVDPEIARLVSDSYPEAARDLQAYRARINVPTLDTVGVARTTVPGLERRVYGGASTGVRKAGGLPPAEKGNIKSRFGNPLLDKHAEEDLANQFDRDVEGLGLQSRDLDGHELTIHLSRPPCPACLAGLNSDARPGVLKQLSTRYRNLTIHVTWDAEPGVALSRPPHLIVRDGTYVKGSH
jgi:hypothetical protein